MLNIAAAPIGASTSPLLMGMPSQAAIDYIAANTESRFELETSRGRLTMALPAACSILTMSSAATAEGVPNMKSAAEYREQRMKDLEFSIAGMAAFTLAMILGLHWYLRRENLRDLNEDLEFEIPRMRKRIDALLGEFRAKGEVAPLPDVYDMFMGDGEWPYADIYPETVLLAKEMSDILTADPDAETVLGLVGPTKALEIWWGEHQQYPEDNAKRLRALTALLFGPVEGTTINVINRVISHYFNRIHRPAREKDVTEAAIYGIAAKEHERIAETRPYGVVRANEEEFALVRALHLMTAAMLRRRRAARFSKYAKRKNELLQATTNIFMAKMQMKHAGNEAVLFDLRKLADGMQEELDRQMYSKEG